MKKSKKYILKEIIKSAKKMQLKKLSRLKYPAIVYPLNEQASDIEVPGRGPIVDPEPPGPPKPDVLPSKEDDYRGEAQLQAAPATWKVVSISPAQNVTLTQNRDTPPGFPCPSGPGGIAPVIDKGTYIGFKKPTNTSAVRSKIKRLKRN